MSIAVVCKILVPHFEQAPGEIGSFQAASGDYPNGGPRGIAPQLYQLHSYNSST